MIEVEYDQQDFLELMKDLNALYPEKLVEPELKPLGSSIITEVKPYPRQRATSNRTGHLGRSWHYEVWGMNLDVGNYADYAGYVQGDEQTSVHSATGWTRLRDVMEKKIDQLLDKLSREVDRIWRS